MNYQSWSDMIKHIYFGVLVSYKKGESKKCDDICIGEQHQHWNNVLAESKKFVDKYADTKKYLIYHLRIFHKLSNSYYYKIGYINLKKQTLKQRIIQINQSFDSMGRINIIQIGIVKNDYVEKKILKRCKDYAVKGIQKKNMGYSKEVFKICEEVYDTFSNMENKLFKKYFETQEYSLYMDNCKLIEKWDLDYLTQDKKESIIWNKWIHKSIY